MSQVYSVEIDESGWASFQRRKHGVQLLKIIDPPTFEAAWVTSCVKEF